MGIEYGQAGELVTWRCSYTPATCYTWQLPLPGITTSSSFSDPDIDEASLIKIPLTTTRTFLLAYAHCDMSSSGTFLNRAINVYALPPQLLQNLSVRSIQSANTTRQSEAADQTPAPTTLTANGSSLRCHTCPNAGFETIEDQREHFRSDWHRYNVKAKLTGRAVSAEEWDGMVEGRPF
jgi:hypothetical protein